MVAKDITLPDDEKDYILRRNKRRVTGFFTLIAQFYNHDMLALAPLNACLFTLHDKIKGTPMDDEIEFIILLLQLTGDKLVQQEDSRKTLRSALFPLYALANTFHCSSRILFMIEDMLAHADKKWHIQRPKSTIMQPSVLLSADPLLVSTSSQTLASSPSLSIVNSSTATPPSKPWRIAGSDTPTCGVMSGPTATSSQSLVAAADNKCHQQKAPSVASVSSVIDKYTTATIADLASRCLQ